MTSVTPVPPCFADPAEDKREALCSIMQRQMTQLYCIPTEANGYVVKNGNIHLTESVVVPSRNSVH